MGVNKRSMDIQALRVATTSESVNPLTCIDKAAELLETFGASRPNAVTVRALLRRLDNFSSASLAEQRAVRTAVKGLKLKLERALEVRAEQADEDDGNDPATPSTPVAPAAPPHRYSCSVLTRCRQMNVIPRSGMKPLSTRAGVVSSH